MIRNNKTPQSPEVERYAGEQKMSIDYLKSLIEEHSLTYWQLCNDYDFAIGPRRELLAKQISSYRSRIMELSLIIYGRQLEDAKRVAEDSLIASHEKDYSLSYRLLGSFMSRLMKFREKYSYH